MKHLLLVLMFFSGLPAHAQEPSKFKRNCRVIFPERPSSAPKIAYLFDGKKNHFVTLPNLNFSRVVDLPKGELTLMLVEEEVSDPENPPIGAPIIKIPEGVREFYLLIMPDPKNKILPLRMTMINTGGKFTPGKTLWANLSKKKIIAKLGQSKMSIAPKSQTISDGPLPENGYYRAEFAYLDETAGKYRRMTEQLWWHDANSRHLGFIVPTGGRMPKMYFFRDFRSKIKAQAGQP